MLDRKFKILVLLLFVVVIVNSIIHFNHPAYKFYRENVKQFRSDYNDFVRQVRLELVPSILTVASNSNNSVSSLVSPSLLPSASSSSSSSSASSDSFLDCRFFKTGGRSYIEYNNNYFTDGDDFFGYTILEVRPTIVITDGRVFVIRPSVRNNQNISTFPTKNQSLTTQPRKSPFSLL